MKQLAWVVAAALSAWACHLAVLHATPVDRALPLLAVVVTVLAAVSYPSLMIAVPLLVIAEVALPDEGLRLLAFGVVMAVCSAVSVWGRPPRPSDAGQGRPPLHLIGCILLLRWIPLDSVHFGRELLLLLLCVGIFYVLGRTPFAFAVALVVALFTPAMPLRTLLVPFIVLLASFFIPQFRFTWPSTVVVGLILLFFPWSGVLARAFPYFLKSSQPVRERYVVNQNVPANATLTLDVPERSRALIVSGANVAHLPRGTPLGRIEPGDIELRIGDAADWGYMRRGSFYDARNPLPRNPAGKIRDYGYDAWVDGAGRIALPDARTIRVIADDELPRGAVLQVEGFELE